METSLKLRIFKLLKEDEEFRHAVIGVLGLEDLRAGITSLEKAVKKLVEGQARLNEAIAKLTEGQARLEAGYGRLEDAMIKLAERQTRLEDGYRRLEDTVVKLTEGQARLEAGYGRLEDAMIKLAERQTRLEDTVVKLAEGQARLEEAMAETRRDIVEIRRDLAITRSELGGLSSSVGAMSESMVRGALRRWLSEEGLTVDRLAPIKVRIEGREVEVDFHGRAVDREGRRISVYAEAKSTVRAREVKEFARITAEAERVWGKGVKLMVAFRIYEDAYQAAEEEGIRIVEA
jgi:exonuclease VII small subunit